MNKLLDDTGNYEIALANAAKTIQTEAIANGEANCKIAVESGSASAVASSDDTQRVLAAIAALPQRDHPSR